MRGGRSRGCSCAVQQRFESGDVLGWCCDAFECCCTCSNGLHEFVSGGEGRVSNRFVLKYHCVAEAVAVGGLDVAFVCAVMLR